MDRLGCSFDPANWLKFLTIVCYLELCRVSADYDSQKTELNRLLDFGLDRTGLSYCMHTNLVCARFPLCCNSRGFADCIRDVSVSDSKVKLTRLA